MPPEEVRSAAPVEPAEPWRSFLRDLDQRLIGPIELRCLGGFVVTQHYGIGRETADPWNYREIMEIAGRWRVPLNVDVVPEVGVEPTRF
jgi:hypothetical protein